MATQTKSLMGVSDQTEKVLPELALGDEVFLALCEDTLIFLDLRRDDYVSIEPRFTDRLLESLGLPGSGTSASSGRVVDAAEFSALLSDLAEAGLVSIQATTRPFEMLDHPGDIQELQRFGVGGPGVRWSHLLAMAKAVVRARWKLGIWPLSRAVNSVQQRRPVPPAPPPQEHLRALVEIYRKLRPLFMSRRDKCLLDALTLIEFLASYAIYPNWVFGVRNNAFAAHCWVQLDSLVLDDDLENVCDYAVIMRC